MKISQLPDENSFDMSSINSVEGFKKEIDNFFSSLLSVKDEVTNKFNYVCREILELLDLDDDDDNKTDSWVDVEEERDDLKLNLDKKLSESAGKENFIDGYMRQMEMKAAR